MKTCISLGIVLLAIIACSCGDRTKQAEQPKADSGEVERYKTRLKVLVYRQKLSEEAKDDPFKPGDRVVFKDWGKNDAFSPILVQIGIDGSAETCLLRYPAANGRDFLITKATLKELKRCYISETLRDPETGKYSYHAYDSRMRRSYPLQEKEP